MPPSAETRALIGKRFDCLTVVQIGPRKRAAYTLLCECACGNVELVAALPNELRNRLVTSCGCKKRRRGNDSPLFKGVGDLSASLWQRIQINAERSCIAVRLTIEQAWELFQVQNGCCPLTGRSIRLRGRGREITASLDRIDPTGHYTPDNVFWVHKEVNRSRKAMPLGTYVDLMTLISRYQRTPDSPPPVILEVPEPREKKPFVPITEEMRKLRTKCMVGKQFGYWEICGYQTEVIHGKNRVLALVQCKGYCEGAEQRVDAYSIRRGHSTMCLTCAGHMRAGEAHVQFEGRGTLRAGWLTSVAVKVRQRNAIRRRSGKPEIRFELTVDDVWDMYEQQERCCSLSRLPLHFGKWHEDTNASLDRFDADGHYTPRSVHLVHKDVNLVRDQLTLPEFLSLAGEVATHAARYATGQPYDPSGCLALRRTRAVRQASLGTEL